MILSRSIEVHLALSWNEPLMTKPTKWHLRPTQTQISLGIRPVWSESSLSAWRKLGSLATHWALSEDSDQTGRMPSLIWVFAGRTCHFVGFVMRRLKQAFLCNKSLNFDDEKIRRKKKKEKGEMDLRETSSCMRSCLPAFVFFFFFVVFFFFVFFFLLFIFFFLNYFSVNLITTVVRFKANQSVH